MNHGSRTIAGLLAMVKTVANAKRVKSNQLVNYQSWVKQKLGYVKMNSDVSWTVVPSTGGVLFKQNVRSVLKMRHFSFHASPIIVEALILF